MLGRASGTAAKAEDYGVLREEGETGRYRTVPVLGRYLFTVPPDVLFFFGLGTFRRIGELRTKNYYRKLSIAAGLV